MGQTRKHDRLTFGCLAPLVEGSGQSHQADEEDADRCPPRTTLRFLTDRKLCLVIFPGCRLGRAAGR